MSQQDIRPWESCVSQGGSRQPLHCPMHAKMQNCICLKVWLQPFVETHILGMRGQVPLKQQPHWVTFYTQNGLHTNVHISKLHTTDEEISFCWSCDPSAKANRKHVLCNAQGRFVINADICAVQSSPEIFLVQFHCKRVCNTLLQTMYFTVKCNFAAWHKLGMAATQSVCLKLCHITITIQKALQSSCSKQSPMHSERDILSGVQYAKSSLWITQQSMPYATQGIVQCSGILEINIRSFRVNWCEAQHGLKNTTANVFYLHILIPSVMCLLHGSKWRIQNTRS